MRCGGSRMSAHIYVFTLSCTFWFSRFLLLFFVKVLFLVWNVCSSCVHNFLTTACIILSQVKENLGDLLTPEHDDHFLLRFLRGKIESVYYILQVVCVSTWSYRISCVCVCVCVCVRERETACTQVQCHLKLNDLECILDLYSGQVGSRASAVTV